MSASLFASSMPLTVAITSGGIFLLRFTYCSNKLVVDRTKASVSSSKMSFPLRAVAVELINDSLSIVASTRTRSRPSTNTLSVPSGNLSICRIVARVPTS